LVERAIAVAQMRIAIDTNVLAYAEGVNGAARRKTALALIEKLPAATTFVPVQVLGELFRVLVRKAGQSPERARAAVLGWHHTFPLIETSPSVLVVATDLAVDHGLGIWDAVIVAATAAAGCRLLLSEDLQDGFIWSGVTVANPFAAKKHDLLAGLLKT
jgi:predicted nucleic acid-binding protein